MNEETRKKMLQQIALHEGIMLAAYMDCCGSSRARCHCATPGFLTIGVGHNLDSRPISRRIAMELLDEDVNEITETCRRRIPVWEQIDETRQAAIIEMAFNGTLFNSPKALEHLARLDYSAFATEMLDGPWKSQVGKRADTLTQQVALGQWKGGTLA